MPKNDGKTLKIKDVRNVKNGAERETFIKNQGSRGSAAERNLHQKMMNIGAKITEKMRKNLCKTECGN